MQNWRPDRDQDDDEEEKKRRQDRINRKKQINEPPPPSPSNSSENTAPRVKKKQEECTQEDDLKTAVKTPEPASNLSSSESVQHKAATTSEMASKRSGSKSVPTSRRSSSYVAPAQRLNKDESQRSSIRSTSTQRSMRSGLSLSMTQDDPNESLQTNEGDEAAPEVNPEAIARLEEFVATTLSQPFDTFSMEYNKRIKCIVPFDWQVEESKNNKRKNRYTDIFCLDSTRVILRDPDGEARRNGNYIHANYVSSDELRKTYILAQGPKKETVVDFWHMVWQVQCPVIVMLCDYTENGKKKCVQYLPPNNSMVQVPSAAGKMTIRTSGARKHSGGLLIENNLVLTEDGKDLRVKHWKWTGWGDFKAPTEFQTVFRLLREMRHSERGFPIVHCSAGVGRSGTLVALEVCLAVLRSGKALNVKNCVETVRRQRAHSVQTVVQYVFLYRALLEMSVINDVITQEQMKAFRLAYDKMVKKGR